MEITAKEADDLLQSWGVRIEKAIKPRKIQDVI
jgi:hypothetical protein